MASLVAHPCAACAQSHPIFNFIFQYYFIEKRILLRWTPGPGVLVRGAAPVEPLLWQGRGWQAHADGGHYDPRQLHSGKPGRLNGLRRARDILRRTAERAAHLNCFGMHEWAMLYQPDGECAPPRHQQLPLRLEQAALNRVVAETRIACTHFDAYRFFAPSVSRSTPPWGSHSHRRRAYVGQPWP